MSEPHPGMSRAKLGGCLSATVRRTASVSLEWEDRVGVRTSDVDKKSVASAALAVHRSAWCGRGWTTCHDEPRNYSDLSVSVGKCFLFLGDMEVC